MSNFSSSGRKDCCGRESWRGIVFGFKEFSM
jgi:hypothetical protein